MAQHGSAVSSISGIRAEFERNSGHHSEHLLTCRSPTLMFKMFATVIFKFIIPVLGAVRPFCMMLIADKRRDFRKFAMLTNCPVWTSFPAGTRNCRYFTSCCRARFSRSLSMVHCYPQAGYGRPLKGILSLAGVAYKDVCCGRDPDRGSPYSGDDDGREDEHSQRPL
jgi:hypothetical protein